MSTNSLPLYLVVTTFLALFTPIDLAAQPVYSEESDQLYARDYLHPFNTWRFDFETRKSISEQLIAETPIIVGGIIVSTKYVIVKDELRYEIILDVSHTYRGSGLSDTLNYL